MQQAMNSVRHGKSAPFEAKSCYDLAEWQGLPCQVVVLNLIKPAETKWFQTSHDCTTFGIGQTLTLPYLVQNELIVGDFYNGTENPLVFEL